LEKSKIEHAFPPNACEIIGSEENMHLFAQRAKEHETAITAFAKFKEASPNTDHSLIIAGGFESQIKHIESVPYFQELVGLATRLGLTENQDIFFFKDVNDSQRTTLLRHATCVLYPPRFEHFGIISTEAMCLAMCLGTPVIACNNAGPKESVSDGETGFLLPAVLQLINDIKLLKDRVEEIKRIVDLSSHFSAWKDFEILAAYESTDIRIKQDYEDIMSILRIKLRFWINLKIDKRFTDAQNFKKIWIPCFTEFL